MIMGLKQQQQQQQQLHHQQQLLQQQMLEKEQLELEKKQRSAWTSPPQRSNRLPTVFNNLFITGYQQLRFIPLCSSSNLTIS